MAGQRGRTHTGGKKPEWCLNIRDFAAPELGGQKWKKGGCQV
jgi:hypothetical protein